MANNSTPATTGASRVFILNGRARPDHRPLYDSCLKAMGIDQALGDVEKIECPDPDARGQFVEIGEIQGAVERPTTSLVGRYPLDEASLLAAMAKARCRHDVQIHFGKCTDPRDFNQFTKAVIYENLKITNYGTDDLGALSSDENAAINETGDISAREFYEVLPLGFAERAGDIVTNEAVDVVICSTKSCGDCDDEDEGCEKIYVLTKAAGGSPSTPADIVYSLDKGVTWYARDIDTLTSSEQPDALACLGANIVVVSSDSLSLHYAAKTGFTATGVPTWAEVATGFVAAKGPNDIWTAGSKSWIVGDGGYIYTLEDPTAGVTVVDAGVAVTDDLHAIHMLDETFGVAVGNAGSIVKTENGTVWSAITQFVADSVNLTCVWVKSTKEWWVGTSTGVLYYTLDGGTTWTQKSFPGSGTGVVRDIQFAKESVGFLSHDTTAPRGRLLQTFNGGYDWVVLPQSVAPFPLSDRMTALAACKHDPNFVVAVGLADNGSDGFVVIGED